MQQLTTRGIILTRTDFGEADRIITLLTPDYGKLRLMAKGVRRVKSKLAGGVELFSVSHITFIKGRGEVGTLVSARLDVHYGQIVTDVDRTMLGYELIKQLHKATEDHTDADYFALLLNSFAALNDHQLPLAIIRVWFLAQLLELSGQAPNLQTTTDGSPLNAELRYSFDTAAMGLIPAQRGSCTAQHIKFLRLAFSGHSPATLGRVTDGSQLASDLLPSLRGLANAHLNL